MRKNKLLLLLALLLTAATGAWAQTETLLKTITNTGENASFTSGSKTFDDIATVTFSAEVHNDGDNWGWYNMESSLLTVAGADGYTITRVKFYSANGSAFDEEAPFEATVASTHAYVNGTDIGQWGVTKIEVYGYEGTAEPAATGYTVSLKDGVKDADKWKVKVGDGQAQALPIGGLTGDGSETVTLQYTGRLKVKGVKATSDAAAASVPDGAISGKFSVSDGKQVYFSKGNLRYASSKWSFFDNQYDYYDSYSADAWDKFGWSTSATTYGMNTSTSNSTYSGDFVDWGATMGTGWFTLSSAEWTYLFNTRSASTVGGTSDGRYAKAKVNDVQGIILFPDTYTHPDGVTAPTGVNVTGDTGWNGNSYSSADWTKMESAGCVFLPATGNRYGSSVEDAGSLGHYWSATPFGTDYAYYMNFASDYLNPAEFYGRGDGYSVRLVREAATSDAEPAKEPATVTTAPTGAAIVGVGKTTALVSGGAAEGGTMMYKVTTENTKPASTDGFSDAVPTAQGITASGKVYVWYYVKGDPTHSDSEIAATAIEVPVADVVWDATNISGLSVYDTDEYEVDGVKLSGNAEQVSAKWKDSSNPTKVGIEFSVHASGGFTFTAPAGKKFTKIDMKPQGAAGWDLANLGEGWDMPNTATITWTGSAASTVGLLTGANSFSGKPIISIAFYLSE